MIDRKTIAKEVEEVTFAEETFDINGDGTVPQIYNYQQTFNFFNSRFLTSPYSNNQIFHGIQGQDDWRNDDSGVEYFHIFGERSQNDTVDKLVAIPRAREPLSITRRVFGFWQNSVPEMEQYRGLVLRGVKLRVVRAG